MREVKTRFVEKEVHRKIEKYYWIHDTETEGVNKWLLNIYEGWYYACPNGFDAVKDNMYYP